MIIRTHDDSQLFITQPDHARLAAQAISHWRDDGFDDHPRRPSILLAAREHDNGWREEDTTTHVDANGFHLRAGGGAAPHLAAGGRSTD